MITHVSRPQTRRVLMVDDELANPTTAGGRAVRALARPDAAKVIVDRALELIG